MSFNLYSPTESNIGKSPLSCDAYVHHPSIVDLNTTDALLNDNQGNDQDDDQIDTLLRDLPIFLNSSTTESETGHLNIYKTICNNLCKMANVVDTYLHGYHSACYTTKSALKEFIIKKFNIPVNIEAVFRNKLDGYFNKNVGVINPSEIFDPTVHKLILFNFSSSKNQLLCYTNKFGNYYMFPSLISSYKDDCHKGINVKYMRAVFSCNTKCVTNYCLELHYDSTTGEIIYDKHDKNLNPRLVRLEHNTISTDLNETEIELHGNIQGNVRINDYAIHDTDLGKINKIFNDLTIIPDYNKTIDITTQYSIIKPNYTLGWALWDNKITSIEYMYETINELICLLYKKGNIENVVICSDMFSKNFNVDPNRHWLEVDQQKIPAPKNYKVTINNLIDINDKNDSNHTNIIVYSSTYTCGINDNNIGLFIKIYISYDHLYEIETISNNVNTNLNQEISTLKFNLTKLNEAYKAKLQELNALCNELQTSKTREETYNNRLSQFLTLDNDWNALKDENTKLKDENTKLKDENTKLKRTLQEVNGGKS